MPNPQPKPEPAPVPITPADEPEPIPGDPQPSPDQQIHDPPLQPEKDTPEEIVFDEEEIAMIRLARPRPRGARVLCRRQKAWFLGGRPARLPLRGAWGAPDNIGDEPMTPEDAERQRRKIQKQLDEALEDSFPASDPVSIVTSGDEEDWGAGTGDSGTAPTSKEPAR